jgi:hypothetical protein
MVMALASRQLATLTGRHSRYEHSSRPKAQRKAEIKPLSSGRISSNLIIVSKI